MPNRSRMLKMHPAALVLLSFLLLILTGALLLMLNISTTEGHISWIDALFTATSAVCVTVSSSSTPGRSSPPSANGSFWH